MPWLTWSHIDIGSAEVIRFCDYFPVLLIPVCLYPLDSKSKSHLEVQICLSPKQVLQNLCILVLPQFSFTTLLEGISYPFFPFFSSDPEHLARRVSVSRVPELEQNLKRVDCQEAMAL